MLAPRHGNVSVLDSAVQRSGHLYKQYLCGEEVNNNCDEQNDLFVRSQEFT